jgi:hypothetical protein
MQFTDVVRHLLRSLNYAQVLWYIGRVRLIRTSNPAVAVLLEIHVREFNYLFYQWPGLAGMDENPGRMDKGRRVSCLRRQCRCIHTSGYDQAIQ